jgi:hypothetical protein
VITLQARESFERIFGAAARTRLAVDANDVCEVEPLGREGHACLAGGDVVVLTIASLDFRMLLLLRFATDDATQRYYVGDRTDITVSEACMEIGNLCCGAINQQLVEAFPDLGMSTPYMLPGERFVYLNELKPDYLASWQVTIGGQATVVATLCVCANADVDFTVNETCLEEGSGELELF